MAVWNKEQKASPQTPNNSIILCSHCWFLFHVRSYDFQIMRLMEVICDICTIYRSFCPVMSTLTGQIFSDKDKLSSMLLRCNVRKYVVATVLFIIFFRPFHKQVILITHRVLWLWYSMLRWYRIQIHGASISPGFWTIQCYGNKIIFRWDSNST